MTELKPCPFCGGEAHMFKLHDWWVSHGCEVLGRYLDTHSCDTEAEAIAAWNTRAERTCQNVDKYASDGFFICGNCGFGDNAVELTPNYCPNCGAKVVGE